MHCCTVPNESYVASTVAVVVAVCVSTVAFDYVCGAPNASGMRSIVYFLLAMYMIGTPGT